MSSALFYSRTTAEAGDAYARGSRGDGAEAGHDFVSCTTRRLDVLNSERGLRLSEVFVSKLRCLTDFGNITDQYIAELRCLHCNSSEECQCSNILADEQRSELKPLKLLA
jgi:hypothetical protein